MKQTFDEFLDKYLDEQDETVRAEYEKAKEELKKELLEKQSEFNRKTNSKAYIATTTSKKRR